MTRPWLIFGTIACLAVRLRPICPSAAPPATFGKSTRRFSNVVASACRIPIVPAPHTPIPDHPTQASASAVAPHGASIAFFDPKSAPAPDDPSCPDAGEKRHGGCEDPIRDAAPFDLWELARSWTPGFCASGGRRTCAKKECALADMVPALTLHGMWPSYSSPVDPRGSAAVDANDGNDDAASPTCYWPQDCTRPSWLPVDSPWSYDPGLLPSGDEFRTLAPAWYTDGLGGHEWPKHGTCAAWADAAGEARGLDQASYYASMFDLARREGTPDALTNAAGGSIPLRELQDAFGGPKRVALGCTPRCELTQVVTCYAQGAGTEDDPAGPRARADCPCAGVRDSHYDNSCAERHACAEVTVLSPEQTGCGGGPGPGPGPRRKCPDGAQCCPGVKGPACSNDADCEGLSGCSHCAHSGHCTDQRVEQSEER